MVLLPAKAAPCATRQAYRPSREDVIEYPTVETAMTTVIQNSTHFLPRRSATSPAKGRAKIAAMEKMPVNTPASVRVMPMLTAYFGSVGMVI